MQLFSFCIILGLPRQVTAICGAMTVVKIFFRKFIIKSCSLEVVWAVYKSGPGTRGRGHWDGDIGTRVWGLGTWGRETKDLGTSSMGCGDVWDRDVGR